MNYYKKVAEMLGVELDEEFNLKGNYTGEINNCRYKITQEGLMYNCGRMKWTRSNLLLSIINGTYSVVKLPWKPKNGEAYWKWDTYVEMAQFKRWNGASTDFACWKLGNCFKASEEAQSKGKEIMEQIKKEFDEA